MPTHVWAGAHAAGTLIGEVYAMGGETMLDGCEVTGSVVVVGEMQGALRLFDCLVRGDVTMDVALDEYVLHGVRLFHNTVLGDLSIEHRIYDDAIPWPYHVRSNIISGVTAFTGWDECLLAVTHNDFVGGVTYTAACDSVFANTSEDPLFCPGDLTLQECSPCVSTAHDGGDRGAFGVGCPCETPVEETSWSGVKAMFR
jgi:hypothetical protein